MSKATIFMSVQLNAGVKPTDFEKFILNEVNPKWLQLPGLLQASLLRCHSGESGGSYLITNTYESAERFDQLWPGWDEPGEEVVEWIAAHQTLWDKQWSMCSMSLLSEDAFYYLEL